MDFNEKPRINVLYTALYAHKFVNCNGLKIFDYTKFPIVFWVLLTFFERRLLNY